jgi:hypothetical protein
MKGYRTIIFNVLAMLVPIFSLTEWHAILPPEWSAYWMLAVGVGNVILRSITTTPVGRRE